MKSIYDYDNNISVITTPNGDKVITMNSEIFVSILNHLYDAGLHQESKGYQATAENTYKLWGALNDKEERSVK